MPSIATNAAAILAYPALPRAKHRSAVASRQGSLVALVWVQTISYLVLGAAIAAVSGVAAPAVLLVVGVGAPIAAGGLLYRATMAA